MRKSTSSLPTAATLTAWLDELGRVSDERGRLTRTFLSPAMRRANSVVGKWMRAVGMTVRIDGVGNLIGRMEGARPRTRTLLLGSHLDTVRNAGRFDGALGVLLPIVALAELRRRGIELPFAVEVLGFSEEEGVRFGSAYLGSKGYAGQLSAADLAQSDAGGITVRAALDRWAGGEFRVPRPAHRRDELVGYVETHIEQGPVLESRRLAVGVVSGIAGQTRVRVTFHGKAGHAGTTPMPGRRDALAGAAELIAVAEGLAIASPPLVATVGTIAIEPGAPNVIPEKAVIALDVRHPRDLSRRMALQIIRAGARQIARRRRLALSWQVTQDNPAVPCSPGLTADLEASVKSVQKRCLSLVSGAGHDAVVMSAITPVAMLFVRCRKGLSHHPDEFVAPADLDVALRVLIDCLLRLAEREGRANR